MHACPGFWRAALCSAVLLSATLLSDCPVMAGEPQWVEIQSPHFSVLTDAGDRRGRDAALRFEQMRAVFGTLMTKAKVNIPVPLQIVAFRNSKELRQVAPIFKGKPTEVAGLFQGGLDRSFIMLDMSAENPWNTVFHEYAHLLMNGNMEAAMDPWFEEGFAEYFSSIEVDGKEAKVGQVPHDTYVILQQVGMMRVADLMKVQQYSETYNESGNRRTAFYAESSILVHYIYDNQLLPKLAVYFDFRVNKHASVEDAIQQAFGMNASQFDQVLRGYVASGHYKYYAIKALPDIADKNYLSHPVAPSDASAVIADIHLHSPDYQDKALAEFQEILKSDPNNASACRGLGYAYLRRSDFRQAAEYFQRASQLNSKDPRVHYYNALLTLRETGFSRGDDMTALVSELEVSISLDPNFADSYALLAFAQSNSGEPVKALETMRKALAIDPRNENYRFNLANLFLANHQPDQAIAILQTLQATNNPALAAQVTQTLESVRQVRQTQSTMPAMPLVRAADSGGTSASPDDSPGGPSAPAQTHGKWSAPVFLRGTINTVDCSTEPSATLTIASGSNTIKLTVSDRNHLIIMGADQFSCGWSKRKVAVNYRTNDAGETSVMSLELQ
jgi:tetratricopeptide (TPR) repeat protein